MSNTTPEMTAEELKALFSPLLGEHGWQAKLAEHSLYTRAQINNLAKGNMPIKGSVANYFLLLAYIFRRGLTIQDIINDLN